jgi:hypothetical protein
MDRVEASIGLWKVPMIENSHPDQPPEVLFVERPIRHPIKPLVLLLHSQGLAKQGVVLDQTIHPEVVPVVLGFCWFFLLKDWTIYTRSQ